VTLLLKKLPNQIHNLELLGELRDDHHPVYDPQDDYGHCPNFWIGSQMNVFWTPPLIQMFSMFI
jgi:hypothetical protein